MEKLGKESLRIVQADDDQNYRMLTQIFLQRAGYSRPVATFETGTDLVDHYQREGLESPPHVVLLDLNMPGMSGLDVIRWLRRNHPEIDSAIYLMTSSDNSVDICTAALSGANKYFLKTGFFDPLIAELDRLVDELNRRDRHKSLRGVRAELALMGEHAPYMVVLTDREGRVEWVNENFVRGCGYPLSELRGRKPGEVLQGPRSDPREIARLHEAIATEQACHCGIINYRKDGSSYLADLSIGPFYQDGRLDGFLGVAKDLSVWHRVAN
jgi:PAS domain S-box-containing protein